MGVLRRVEVFFEAKGVRKTNIPTAIFIHELLGVLMLAVTWSACYKWPLSSNPLVWGPIQGAMNKLPSRAVVGVKSGIEKMPWSPKVTEAYFESSCLRKIVRPLTLPGKLWLTYYAIKSLDDSEIMAFSEPH